MCEATTDRGATEREMVARYREICRGRARPRSELEEAAELALAAFQASDATLDESLSLLLVVNVLLIALLALIAVIVRLIPGASRLTVILGRIPLQRVQAAVIQIRVRRAANEDVFRRLETALRQAA